MTPQLFCLPQRAVDLFVPHFPFWTLAMMLQMIFFLSIVQCMDYVRPLVISHICLLHCTQCLRFILAHLSWSAIITAMQCFDLSKHPPVLWQPQQSTGSGSSVLCSWWAQAKWPCQKSEYITPPTDPSCHEREGRMPPQMDAPCTGWISLWETQAASPCSCIHMKTLEPGQSKAHLTQHPTRECSQPRVFREMGKHQGCMEVSFPCLIWQQFGDFLLWGMPLARCC